MKIIIGLVISLAITFSCASQKKLDSPPQPEKKIVTNDTVFTSSGLAYLKTFSGTGEKAVAGKTVEVHYTGRLLNGKIFDSSRERGEAIEFELGAGRVIKGWDEGIALMKVGDRFTLIIPSDLAYGSRGRGELIPPNSDLIFDVELMSVSETKESIADLMMVIIFESGVDSAIQKYREARIDDADRFNFTEKELNRLGYTLLQNERPGAALAVFKLNIEQFPNSANTYDSYGEALAVNGKKKEAIENYKKSLELNPKNENARKMLEKLGSAKED